MKHILNAIILSSILSISAFAHEYSLRFTPPAGARGLVVAGYQITNGTVTGTCSYYVTTSGSGRGGGYRTTTTYHNQTCTWDITGNLLGVVAGALPPHRLCIT
jgi:hypothetical protein